MEEEDAGEPTHDSHHQQGIADRLESEAVAELVVQEADQLRACAETECPQEARVVDDGTVRVERRRTLSLKRDRDTVRQSFSDDSTPSCSTCGSQHMRRIISSVSIVKSELERTSNLSWVDKNLAGRIKKKASRKLSPALQDTVDRMESH